MHKKFLNLYPVNGCQPWNINSRNTLRIPKMMWEALAVLITILMTDSHYVCPHVCVNVCTNEKSHQISRNFSSSWDDQLYDFLMENKPLSVQTEKLDS